MKSAWISTQPQSFTVFLLRGNYSLSDKLLESSVFGQSGRFIS